TRRSAWSQGRRGLGPADLAMHVVLPELDGRVLQGVVAFKGPLPAQDDLCFSAFGSLPEVDRVTILADRIAALVKLQATPRSERRVALLLPDYPGAPGRAGYAVGLDVPASVVGLLSDMEQANYGVAGAPKTSRALLDALVEPSNDAALPLDRYRDLVATFPNEAIARVQAAWGDASNDSDVRDGAFRFRARTFGNILVAFPPDRRRSTARLSRLVLAAPQRVASLRPLPSPRCEGRCHRPHGRARHPRMAAWQGRRADRLMLPGIDGRVLAGDLSLHRQQPRGSRAGKAADRGGNHRPPAAAARRGRP